MLTRILTGSLALGLLLPILLRADDAQKNLDKDLDGKWEGASWISDGEELKEGFVILLVEKDKFTLTTGTRITLLDDGKERQVEDSDTVKGTIKADLKSSPKAIDFTWREGTGKGKTNRSIYEIKGDVLRFCTSGVEKDRPTEFSSKKGSGLMIVVLKRAKK